MKPVENLVFDLGNVLIDFNPRHAVNKIVADHAEQEFLYTTIFRSAYWKQYDQGLITFDELNKTLTDNHPQYTHQINWTLHNWYKDQPYLPGMFNLVSKLNAAGYPLFLLSNANPSFYTFAPNLDILNLFTGITISSDLKLLKPDKEIYDRFCEIHHLHPDEILFIDDQQKNVDGAIAAGWRAYRFTDACALQYALEEQFHIKL